MEKYAGEEREHSLTDFAEIQSLEFPSLLDYNKIIQHNRSCIFKDTSHRIQKSYNDFILSPT